MSIRRGVINYSPSKFQKFKGSCFGPVFSVVSKGHEPDMAAGRGSLKMEEFTRFRFFIREGRFGKERIISCVNQKRWNADSRQKLSCAAPFEIIFRIPESMDRGGVTVIQFEEGTDLMKTCRVDLTRHSLSFFANFWTDAS